jgi:hypothetical protein
MPAVFLILVCFVGAGFTLLMFAGWLIFTIFRLLAAGIVSLIHPRSRHAIISQSVATPGWYCQRATCRTANPCHARFCRRCGHAVVVESVKARPRMAMASL